MKNKKNIAWTLIFFVSCIFIIWTAGRIKNTRYIDNDSFDADYVASKTRLINLMNDYKSKNSTNALAVQEVIDGLNYMEYDQFLVKEDRLKKLVKELEVNHIIDSEKSSEIMGEILKK